MKRGMTEDEMAALDQGEMRGVLYEIKSFTFILYGQLGTL